MATSRNQLSENFSLSLFKLIDMYQILIQELFVQNIRTRSRYISLALTSLQMFYDVDIFLNTENTNQIDLFRFHSS